MPRKVKEQPLEIDLGVWDDPTLKAPSEVRVRLVIRRQLLGRLVAKARNSPKLRSRLQGGAVEVRLEPVDGSHRDVPGQTRMFPEA